MKRIVRSIFVGVVALTSVQIFALSASADSPNRGCGEGFTEYSVSVLAQFATDTYGEFTYDQWFAAFSSYDKNGDSNLCSHPIGKLCSCGANAINIVDNKANASDS